MKTMKCIWCMALLKGMEIFIYLNRAVINIFIIIIIQVNNDMANTQRNI